MSPKKSFTSYLQYAVLFFFSVIILVNAVRLGGELQGIAKIKKVMPFYFPGLKFSGLDTFLKDSERVGYYTDRDMKTDENARNFAQAQLILAPIILEVDNLKRRYIIFDCADEQHALNKIMSLGARPIKKKGGLILAERQP